MSRVNWFNVNVDGTIRSCGGHIRL